MSGIFSSLDVDVCGEVVPFVEEPHSSSNVPQTVCSQFGRSYLYVWLIVMYGSMASCVFVDVWSVPEAPLSQRRLMPTLS